MSSRAIIHWQTVAVKSLDEIEAAHAAIGGIGPGRRYATQQINHAYVVLLSSHFQAFCRHLHSEAVNVVAVTIPNPLVRQILRQQLEWNRKLDVGNPNPGNLGSDFGRLDLELWPIIVAADPGHAARKLRLEQTNLWRNAVAHQDFDPAKLGGRAFIPLTTVRQWRRDCSALALTMDETVANHLDKMIGVRPW